jgi:hypothetical protein
MQRTPIQKIIAFKISKVVEVHDLTLLACFPFMVMPLYIVIFSIPFS